MLGRKLFGFARLSSDRKVTEGENFESFHSLLSRITLSRNYATFGAMLYCGRLSSIQFNTTRQSVMRIGVPWFPLSKRWKRTG